MGCCQSRPILPPPSAQRQAAATEMMVASPPAPSAALPPRYKSETARYQSIIRNVLRAAASSPRRRGPPRALDVGAGAGVSTEVLCGMGFTQGSLEIMEMDDEGDDMDMEVDFDYNADADDYLHPEFKALQDAPLPDINAGNGMTTSEYEVPLVSLPEDQEHKPCPVIKLNAKLERCSTCESASGRSLRSMDFSLCSWDYGSLINSGNFNSDADDDLHPDEFKTLQDAPLPDINAGNGMMPSEYEEPHVSLPVEPFDNNGNVVDRDQDGGALGDDRDDEDMAEDDDDESDYSYAYEDEDEDEGHFFSFLIPTYPFETTTVTGFPPAVFAEDFAADAVGPSPETSIANSSRTSSIKNKTAKPRRLIDDAVEPTDDDVLFGRGGFTNNHPGNLRFRDKALELRPQYEQSDKEEKCAISKVLVASVTDNGNRFLEMGNDGLWHEVVGNRVGKCPCRKKASQALRERRRTNAA